jgi:hypothetical protein
MEKNLDKFIVSIREKEKPFAYADPISSRHFMLSYDESIDALDDEDFRPYIIAALHAKGATEMKSYVASTIIFKAPTTTGSSGQALANWKNYLVGVFGPELTIMISVITQYKDLTPVFDKVANPSIETQFDERVTKVKDKFRTLKK